MVSPEIKNLIFDLGGVIMDLDFSRTYKIFADYSGKSVEYIREKMHAISFFNDYEKGLITDEDFRNQVREFLQLKLDDLSLDSAWNAMLLGITKERLDLLTELKLRYRTFLLSNTNGIHVRAINDISTKVSGFQIDHFFHKVYFSHNVKMRKPDPEIFKLVIHEHKLIPAETLFLDDLCENISGAESTGLQTLQITSTNQILSLFS